MQYDAFKMILISLFSTSYNMSKIIQLLVSPKRMYSMLVMLLTFVDPSKRSSKHIIFWRSGSDMCRKNFRVS